MKTAILIIAILLDAYYSLRIDIEDDTKKIIKRGFIGLFSFLFFIMIILGEILAKMN